MNIYMTKFNGDAQKKSDIYPCVKDIIFSLLPSAQSFSEQTDITAMFVMYCKKVPGLNLCRVTGHKATFFKQELLNESY